MSETRHVIDQLQDLLDERLPQDDAALVRDHIAGCEACRSEVETLQRVRQATRRLRADVDPPADLLADLRLHIDREMARAVPSAAPAGWPRRRLLLAGSGVAASILVAAGLWNGFRRRDQARQVAAAYRDLMDGRLRLDRITGEPVELEAFFEAAGLPTRVIDLSAMAYRLEGGMVYMVNDSRRALYTYRDGAGQRVVCQMYGGVLGDLPPADLARVGGEFTFLAFRRDGVNMVFWMEGTTVCVLAGELPMEPLMSLAVEKAMAPA